MKNRKNTFIFLILLFPLLGAASVREEPIAIFQQYWDAWVSDAGIDQLLEFMSTQRKAKINDVPPIIRKIAVAFKMGQIRQTVRESVIQSIDQQVEGESVFLTVEAVAKKDYVANVDKPRRFVGKIRMVQEQGAWKIDKESWRKHK